MTAAAAAASTASAADDKKTNGHADWRDWPTENATARSYGLYNTQLRRLVKKHGIDAFKAPDLSWRYSPHACEQIQQAIRSGAIGEIDDEDNDDDEDSPGAGPRGRRQTGKKAADTELTVALRLANEHLRESFKITHSAQKECLMLMQQANKDLIVELASLRESQRASTQAREEALNDRQTRELMIEEQKRKDARWDAALATLTGAIQMLGHQAFETWQDWKKPKNAQAFELLQKLASQIAEKLELSPEQRAELLRVLDPDGKGSAEEPPAPAASSSTPPPAAAPAEPAPAPAEPANSAPPSSGERISADSGPSTSAPSSAAAGDVSSGSSSDTTSSTCSSDAPSPGAGIDAGPRSSAELGERISAAPAAPVPVPSSGKPAKGAPAGKAKPPKRKGT